MKRILACLFVASLTVASLTVASLTLVGCGGGASASSSDDPSGGSATSDDSADGSDTERRDDAARLEFDDVSPRAVTLIEFVDQALVIGFSDGAIAVVDNATGKVEQSKVAQAHAVAAVSPNRDLALLAANPPVIVNFDGKLILQMNTVPSFESATFAPRGMTLYVADKAGKVRVWGQPHSFEEDQHTEQLENYLNRQAPDFHVELPSVSGPIEMTADNKLVIVDDEGVVRLWDPTRPSNAKQIMKVGGGARSISAAAGRIFVTSRTGQLKIAHEDGSGFLPWTRDATGDYVVASPLAVDTFFQLEGGSLRARQIESGEDVWSTSVPDGHSCGLGISADASLLAACIGNFVVLFDSASGGPRAVGYRSGGDFTWNEL